MGIADIERLCVYDAYTQPRCVVVAAKDAAGHTSGKMGNLLLPCTVVVTAVIDSTAALLGKLRRDGLNVCNVMQLYEPQTPLSAILMIKC